MLVLTRKIGEQIIIGDNVSVMVVKVSGDQVRLGITAPSEITVHRREVYQRIQQGGEGRVSTPPTMSPAQSGEEAIEAIRVEKSEFPTSAAIA
jgi:carbon storage regulator